MESKYKEGEIVFERINPAQKLVVSRYVNGLYYCRTHETRAQKERVYLERDLKSVLTVIGKK